MRIFFKTLLMTLAFANLVAHAQEDHSQHQAAPAAATPPASADPHSGHGGANAGASDDGPWSYKGRKNPDPYTKNRWEMVPGEGNAATYVAADKLSKGQRCTALKRQNVQALDRATRAECGITDDTNTASPPAATPSASGNADNHQH